MAFIFPYPALLLWYARYGRRALPWRMTEDAYPIWVSEVMLQQTQVATVLERYYHPFIERFQTIEALASAPEEAVLKMWEGLGYYSRARNLHRAARLTAPRLPDTVDALLNLPGIGRNTAHAIAAFAYRQPVAVMEANVRRVIYRVLAAERLTEKELWEHATAWVYREDPFTYNQAMMDIGALLCTPRTPQCPQCPLRSACAGQHAPERFPAPKAKKQVPVRRKLLLIVQDATGRTHLTARNTAMLSGLYGCEEYEDSPPAQEVYWENIRYPLATLRHIGDITHSYSHFRLLGRVYVLHLPEHGQSNGWFTPEEITALPLSMADRKALALLRAPDHAPPAALGGKPSATRHSPARRKSTNRATRQAASQ